MGLDIQKAAFDVETITNGRWVPTSRGGEICVARWNNPQFRLLQTDLQYKFRKPRQGKKQIKGTRVPPEISEEITFELIVETVLLGWRDFSDGEQPFPYSKSNARQLLSQEAFHWLMEEVQIAANDEEAWFRKQQEDDQGNLPSVSAGTSSGASMPNGLSS